MFRLFVPFFLFFCTVSNVVGWGAVGHEVAATIAQMHLHPTVLPILCDILNYTHVPGADPPCHLAPVAAWADRIKYSKRWSAAQHYIGALDDYPSRDCEFPGPRGWAGRPSNNVLGAIHNDTAILHAYTRGNVGIDTANEALKFLIHYVGDMHMPLHLTNRDRGGNSDKVLFDGRQTSLHSLWDSRLIAQSLRTIPRNYTRPLPIPNAWDVEKHLRNTIYDPYIRRIVWEGFADRWQKQIPGWLTCPATFKQPQSLWRATMQEVLGLGLGAVEEDDTDTLCPYYWAKSIHALNCAFVWPKELDEPPYSHIEPAAAHGRSANAPPKKYLELNTPAYAGRIADQLVIEELLARAGVRLAGILNWIFAPEMEDVSLNVYTMTCN